MSDEAWISQPMEVPVETQRKRRKYRRYPTPVCTPEQKEAMWKYMRGLCPICMEAVSLEEGVVDHSYRNSRNRGVLHRNCNAGLGMLHDSPTRLRNALAYLRNPPAKALGFGETEKERSR
jgi:hypothetical protein